ncbi:Leukotoxin [Symmachiella dynata]|nr:Leukotoxin [Symmachiella dynata]
MGHFMSRQDFQQKLDRILGCPANLLSPRLRRALGFDKVEYDLYMASADGRSNIQQKLDRILGSGAGQLPSRVKRGLGFESLEQRLVMSATLGAGDEILNWTDANGNTQALDVTSGSVEVHFTDDVGNTGDITEVRLLSNGAGFDVSTSNIDLINSNGNHMGAMNIGVNVGGELADTDGTVDAITASKHIQGAIFVDGNVGSINVGNKVQDSITVTGDLDSISVGGDIQGDISAEEALGEFSLSDNDFSYNATFSESTAVTFDGTTEGIETLDESAQAVRTMSPSQFRYLTADQVPDLSVEQIASITNANYFYNMSSAARGALNAEQVQALDTSIINIGYLTSAQREDLTPDQVQAVSVSTLRYLPASQVQHITVDQLSSITNANYFYNLSSAARGALNAEQVQALDTSIINIGYLTSAQREDLTPDQVQAVSVSTLRYLPASQVQHITVDQLSSITNANYFYNLSSTARGALNAEQVQALDTSIINIGYLTSAQREDLTPDQVQAVSVSTLRYLPASQVQHITVDQLSSITNANYFYNLSSAARGALNAEQVQALDTSIINIGYLTSAQREDLTPDQVQAVSASRLRYLPASQVQHITVDQLSSITNANYFYNLSSAARGALNAEQVQALDTSIINIGYLTSAQREDLTPDQVQAVSASRLRYLPASQVQHITVDQLSSITNANYFYNLSSAARGALNAEQVQALDTSIINIGYLTSAQREDLSSDQVQAVSASRLRYLPASQVQHITVDQLSAITNANYFYNLSSAARGALNAEQVQALDTSIINIGYLTSAQRENLTPEQVQSLSAANLRYLPASQVQHISLEQLAGITNSNHLRNMSAAARDALSHDQIAALSSTLGGFGYSGSAGDDSLTGNSYSNHMEGLGGDDTISGLAGNDVLNGGAGDDELLGGTGDDLLIGGGGSDVMQGEAGDDTFRFDGAAGGDVYTVSGGEGQDAIDLQEFSVDDIHVEADRIRVNLDGGGQFTIHHDGIESIVLSDGSYALSAFLSVNASSLDLIAHWELDGNATDATGNGHDATVLNGEGDEFTTGLVGDGAAHFDGENDLIQTPSGESPQLTGDYTTSVWIRPDASQKDWAGIYAATNASGSTNHWNLQFDNSAQRNIVIYHANSGSWDTGIDLADVADGGWHNIVVVREGTTMSVYLDGELAKTGTYNSNPLGNADHFNIGGERTSLNKYLYSGDIDDVRIYTGAQPEDVLEFLFQTDNDTPQTTGISDVNVMEDAADTVINLHDAFSDQEDTDGELTYDVKWITNAALFDGMIIDNAGNLTIDYAANASGTAEITIRATDADGKFVESTFLVNVEAENDTPETSGLSDVHVTEDAVDTVINLFDAFSDVEDADSDLTFSIEGNSNPALFDSVTLDASGQLTLNYAANAFGTAEITIRAMDAEGESVESTFTVNVAAANDGPVTTGLDVVNVTEGANDTTIDLTAAFDDVEDGADGLSYSVAGNTNAALFNAVTIDGDGNLTLDYSDKVSGSAEITIRATDAGGEYVESTFMVNVAAAPVIVQESNEELVEESDVVELLGDKTEPTVDTVNDLMNKYFNDAVPRQAGIRWFSTTDEFNLPATFLNGASKNDVPLGLLSLSYSGFHDFNDYFKDAQSPEFYGNNDPLYHQSQYGSGQEALEEWLKKHRLRTGDSKPVETPPGQADGDAPVEGYNYEGANEHEKKHVSHQPEAADESGQLNEWDVDQARKLIHEDGQELLSQGLSSNEATPSQALSDHRVTENAAIVGSSTDLESADTDNSEQNVGFFERGVELLAAAAGAVVVGSSIRGSDDDVDATGSSIAPRDRGRQNDPPRP